MPSRKLLVVAVPKIGRGDDTEQRPHDIMLDSSGRVLASGGSDKDAVEMPIDTQRI